jgi:myo-inositol-1(or 4)-monophosphatase
LPEVAGDALAKMGEADASAGGAMTEVDPHELLAVAVRTAREAAELVARRRREGIGEVATKSTATDPVTAVDKEAEALIRDLLQDQRPGEGFLGEESGDGGGAGTVRWVVDPIDGTVNYVYGIPQYAVSIAAQADGVSVAGVVRNAATGEEWTAVRGGGAWRDGSRLYGSAATELASALVATGFGYAPQRRLHQARVVAELIGQVRDIRRFGAASLDLCFAAEGRVDAYFEKGLAAWDHAAGGLVAAEAGLLVTGLRGAGPSPTMVVAAPPALYGPLHDRLVELDADGGP